MELGERLAQKSCIAVSSPDVAEEADNHYWPHALNQRARVCGYVADADYDIKVVDSDKLRWAISPVKWPTPTPRVQPLSISSMAPPLISSGALSKNLPSYIAIEPLLSFLKDTFCDAGLGSTASKSDLIDGDHEEGTLSVSPKGKSQSSLPRGKSLSVT